MKTKIIIVLSVLVIGLSGILLYESLNTEMSEIEIRQQFSHLKDEYKQIEKDLDMAINDLEINNQEIIAQKEKIGRLIRKNNITEEELNQAKKMMKNLSEVVLKSYKSKVRNLEEKEGGLVKEKESLAQQILKIQKKVEEINDRYNKEKRSSKMKEHILREKEEQINYASRLILSNFILNGFKVRNSGKEIQTDKASRIDRIKVSFDIVPNKLVESGIKKIYTIIKKPSGEIVTFVNQDTGEFIFENKRMKYSDELKFSYTSGEEKTLEFTWDNEDFERGDYVMEVYEKTKNEIVLIGKAIKSLR